MRNTLHRFPQRSSPTTHPGRGPIAHALVKIPRGNKKSRCLQDNRACSPWNRQYATVANALDVSYDVYLYAIENPEMIVSVSHAS